VVPSVITTHFHLREGDSVADFGAGSGYFIEALSKAVGQSGRVYACEIQRELVEKIGTLIRSKGIGNTDPLWCDIEADHGVKIADGLLDAAVLINTLFQVEDKQTTIHEIARTMRSGGKFFVVDWTESFGGLGPHPDQVITAENAKALVETAGFVFERDFDAGDHHYGLAFRKV
jgi:ubiquinone/menaquinone biosynthesis C-methylase UbiE